jgi:predicted GNAT family acetyltransferase
MTHLLDRPIWNALTTRWSALAQGDGRALRLNADYGLFAASADFTAASLAGLAPLIPADGGIALAETEAVAPPPGTALLFQRPMHQMIAERIAPDDVSFAVTELSDDDAAGMLALATLTEPGPFFKKTHRLGGFIGVRVDGRLAAMAGERMKLPGLTEVSGVCTHPDFRGRGYAGGLMRIVAARIAARGETPFLHVWADNTGAIALYETLGYRLRRVMMLTALIRSP